MWTLHLHGRLGRSLLTHTCSWPSLKKNTQHQKMTKCTSLSCSWLPPLFQNIPNSKLVDVDFTTPQLKKRGSELKLKSKCYSKTCIAKELNLLLQYKDLSKAGKPVLLSLVPGYSDPCVSLCVSSVLPNPLTELFSKDHLYLSYPDLLNNVKKCSTLTPSH